jgi:hypothetical protein
LGDKDHAFYWLNIAHQEHDETLVQLRTDFMMDSLRSDPRYADWYAKLDSHNGDGSWGLSQGLVNATNLVLNPIWLEGWLPWASSLVSSRSWG